MLGRFVRRASTFAAVCLAAVGSLGAQRVTLQIHPHVGDTLHMKLDQRFEMTGETPADPSKAHPPQVPSASPPSLPQLGGGFPTAMTATMRIRTHSIILGSTAVGTDLRSITDSVSITPATAATLPLFAQTKRALEGRSVRLHIGIDGAMTLPKGAPAGADAALPPEAAVFVQIPALLPATPVRPGDSWARDLLVPLSAPHTRDGLVRITFHLDSLGPDAAIAYISMHGTFSHDRGQDGSGTQNQTLGTLTGTMQVDRRLQWLTDSRMTVTLSSTVTPPGATHPMSVHVKITQWLRAVPGT